MTSQQTSLEKQLNLSLSEKIALCHSRIPQRRHIVGWQDYGLIAPLPVWSPYPKKHQKTAQDDFYMSGLEAQHPKYLPEILKPFVRVRTRGKGKRKNVWDVWLDLLPGAYKKQVS